MKSSIVYGENRGSVINILLKALQSGDKYGYEINKEIETKSNGKYFLKEASLYSGLKRLEASGHITSYWKEGDLGIRRHYYSITELGLEKLRSSNFSWDGNKEFIDEIFKTQNPVVQKLSSQKSETTSAVSPILRQDIGQKTESNTPETKKNPFQIEVNPLQQSFFDTIISEQENKETGENTSKTGEIQLEKNLNSNKKEMLLPLENYINESSQTQQIENVVELKKNEESKLVLENKAGENIKKRENQKSTYDELISSYSPNSFSNYLSNEREKLDISKLLQNKENDHNIVYVKDSKTPEVVERNVQNENVNDKPQIELPQELDKKTDLLHTEQSEQVFNEEKEHITQKDDEKVDIKNIFGNLLVENDDEKSIGIENIETNEDVEEIIKKQKTELPRINVDNDINVMLNTNSKKFSYDLNSIQEKAMSNSPNSVPSVKQYIDNVHKKTLISRATNIDEEINLEGINIREYTKMNNKIIKNSNYICINKVNLALYAILFIIIALESSLSLVLFNNNGSLKIFDIILYSLIIASIGVIFAFKIKDYYLDKFKVELKNFNFKNIFFYCSLLMVICFILFICIDIFEGMNTNNFNSFGEKIFMQLLLSANFIIYPIIKVILYNSKHFSN